MFVVVPFFFVYFFSVIFRVGPLAMDLARLPFLPSLFPFNDRLHPWPSVLLAFLISVY